MDSNLTFNALGYFEHLAKSNRLAQENDFWPCFCSGPESIDGIMQNFRKRKNFIMIDDTTSQNTYSRGVTFFDKNVYTVFILAHYHIDDMEDRQEKLELCRRIFRQFHSRMIFDKQRMEFGDMLEWLDVSSVYSREMSRYSMSGVTGLYFMVNNDEPVDLTYNSNEWED